VITTKWFIVGLRPVLIVYAYLQHPVYCVNVVGTQNAHNLISVSTDGKMCSWSLDMLSQPQVSKITVKVYKHDKQHEKLMILFNLKLKHHIDFNQDEVHSYWLSYDSFTSYLILAQDLLIKPWDFRSERWYWLRADMRLQ